MGHANPHCIVQSMALSGPDMPEIAIKHMSTMGHEESNGKGSSLHRIPYVVLARQLCLPARRHQGPDGRYSRIPADRCHICLAAAVLCLPHRAPRLPPWALRVSDAGPNGYGELAGQHQWGTPGGGREVAAGPNGYGDAGLTATGGR